MIYLVCDMHIILIQAVHKARKKMHICQENLIPLSLQERGKG
jgi:hypothetical protein